MFPARKFFRLLGKVFLCSGSIIIFIIIYVCIYILSICWMLCWGVPAWETGDVVDLHLDLTRQSQQTWSGRARFHEDWRKRCKMGSDAASTDPKSSRREWKRGVREPASRPSSLPHQQTARLGLGEDALLQKTVWGLRTDKNNCPQLGLLAQK